MLLKIKNLTLLAILFTLSFSACQNESEDEITPEQEQEQEQEKNEYQELNNLFNISEVPNITIETTTEEWNKLLTNFDINEANEEYVYGKYTILKEGINTTLDSIGFRLRGNTSRRRPEGTTGELHNPENPSWHHAHFAVSFKKFRKKQRWEDLEKINLKWFKDDANYVREVYGYDLFERFGIWTAPHSSYCTLTIKIKEDNTPAYFGVYEMVESIDDDYLKNREPLFSSSTGNLWKASWGADLKNADDWRMGVENITLDPNTMEEYIYDLKTNKELLSTAKNQLKNFITTFNSKQGNDFQTWIESKMDVDLFLKSYACSTILGHWDDYWVNNNNFYFYFNEEGKFFYIPYDLDNILGTSLIINDSGTQNLLRWGNSNDHPFVSKFLAITKYRNIYINYLYDLTNPNNDLFYSTTSISRIEDWQSMVSPYVSNDTGEDMVIGDEPASWGNQPGYRLNSLSNNFFVVRENNLPAKP